MTERERWVVYPLLFLALGAALRDKLVDRTTTKSIVCQELLVVDEQPLGREPVLLAHLGRADGGDTAQAPPSGLLRVNGHIEVVDPLSRPLVSIGRAPLGPDGQIGGNVGVNGKVTVNGVINSTFYAYQGVPILPALRGVIPGAALPAEIFQALPQAIMPAAPTNSTESQTPAPPRQPSPQSPTQKDDGAPPLQQETTREQQAAPTIPSQPPLAEPEAKQ